VFNDARQTYVHNDEPLVFQVSYFEVGVTIEELEICATLGIDQIRVESVNSGMLQDTEKYPGRWNLGGWVVSFNFTYV